MPRPQHHQSLLAFLCCALFLGIVSSETLDCNNSYDYTCFDNIYWNATGLESKEYTLTLPAFYTSTNYFYISDAAQNFSYSATSWAGSIMLRVDVNSSTVVGGYSNYFEGNVSAEENTNSMDFYFTNENWGPTTVTLNLNITSFYRTPYIPPTIDTGAAGTAVATIGIIVIVVPIIGGLAIISGIICCIVQRNKRLRASSRQTVMSFNPGVSAQPIKTLEQAVNPDPSMSFANPDNSMSFNYSQYSQHQNFSNQYFQQNQNIQGYVQTYPQGFDQIQLQPVYYVQPQPQPVYYMPQQA